MPAFKLHKANQLLHLAVSLLFAGILMLTLHSSLVQTGLISGAAEMELVLNDDETPAPEKEDAGKEFSEPADLFFDTINDFHFGQGSSVHRLVALHISLPGVAMDIPIPPPKIPPGQ